MQAVHSYPSSEETSHARERCKCVLTGEHIVCICTKCERTRKQYLPNSQQLRIRIVFAENEKYLSPTTSAF